MKFLETLCLFLVVNLSLIAQGPPSNAALEKMSIAELDSMVSLHNEKGDYEQAIALSERVVGIRAKTIGREHSDYARSISNLAGFYSVVNDKTASIEMYLEAKRIWEKTSGTAHPDYQSAMFGRGGR